MLGFMITRHVNSEQTNSLWIESYNSIRKFYPDNIIMIIDDNSDINFIKIPENLGLINCFVIQSEFPQRGEILALYYFNKYKLFDKAVIVHDSVFFQSKVDFNSIEDIKFLWYFYHDWDDTINEKQILKTLHPSTTLLDMYEEKESWYGCFGAQCVISREFLSKLVKKYNIFDLLSSIRTRSDRMAFERIFGLICCHEKPDFYDDCSLFGNIMTYCKWNYTFKEYKEKPFSGLPIIKVWTGR